VQVDLIVTETVKVLISTRWKRSQILSAKFIVIVISLTRNFSMLLL